ALVAGGGLLAAPPTLGAQQRRRPAPRPPRSTTALARIPTPKSVLGFEPGEDRRLPEWPALLRYYQVLARASDRGRYHALGKTTLGTTAEGSDPPELYHHYTGHDNNRDWYAFTQVETQLVVDSLYNVWHPEIVHDIHQQDSDGSRLFLPPYLDPVEPNVDPLLVD